MAVERLKPETRREGSCRSCAARAPVCRPTRHNKTDGVLDADSTDNRGYPSTFLPLSVLLSIRTLFFCAETHAAISISCCISAGDNTRTAAATSYLCRGVGTARSEFPLENFVKRRGAETQSDETPPPRPSPGVFLLCHLVLYLSIEEQFFVSVSTGGSSCCSFSAPLRLCVQ